MIDNTVKFEQIDFLDRLSHGWDVREARDWFAKERQARNTSQALPMLAALITDLVITDSAMLPPTFTLDYIRMQTLQSQFQRLMYQIACRWTFEETLNSLSQKSIPQSSYNDLYARISVLTSDEESRRYPSQKTKDISLEIVRLAYRLSSPHKVPSSEDLDFAESNLLYASSPSTNVFESLQRYLAEDLHQLVEDEVTTIKDLTLVQITNRYHSEPSIRPGVITEESDLLRIAQQIAHISVLHWRVWGPILYDQPHKPQGT